ncbi:MAG: hypothetical protein ABIY52_00945 [Gemmatimonadaceae bacterium]
MYVTWRLSRLVTAVLCLSAIATQPLAGQSFGSITFDSLQLSALSLDVGRIAPSQSERATVFGIGADYGRLSRSLRLRFEGAFWESRLTDKVTATYLDSVRHSISDPSRDDAPVSSRVNLYDVSMGVGVRYLPVIGTVIQPYAGAGIGVHVINAEGRLIDGTFAERLFDNIATGLFAETGVLVKPLPRIGIDARIRGDLVNAFRSLSLRAGGIYWFGPLRRSDP